MEQFDPDTLFKGGKYVFRRNGSVLFQQKSDMAEIVTCHWEKKQNALSVVFEKVLVECDIKQMSSRKMMWQYFDNINIYLVSAPVPANLQINADSLLAVQEIRKAM